MHRRKNEGAHSEVDFTQMVASVIVVANSIGLFGAQDRDLHAIQNPAASNRKAGMRHVAVYVLQSLDPLPVQDSQCLNWLLCKSGADKFVVGWKNSPQQLVQRALLGERCAVTAGAQQGRRGRNNIAYKTSGSIPCMWHMHGAYLVP